MFGGIRQGPPIFASSRHVICNFRCWSKSPKSMPTRPARSIKQCFITLRRFLCSPLAMDERRGSLKGDRDKACICEALRQKETPQLPITRPTKPPAGDDDRTLLEEGAGCPHWRLMIAQPGAFLLELAIEKAPALRQLVAHQPPHLHPHQSHYLRVVNLPTITANHYPCHHSLPVPLLLLPPPPLPILLTLDTTTVLYSPYLNGTWSHLH